MRAIDGTAALARARELRRFSTDVEKCLWARLRGRHLEGFKFRRQVWIGSYIADFLCLEAKLIVEADGAQHGENAEYDLRRDTMLKAEGYRVLRFWNNEVIGNLDGVLEAIRAACLERVPSPSQAFGLGPSLSQRRAIAFVIPDLIRDLAFLWKAEEAVGSPIKSGMTKTHLRLPCSQRERG
jgi:very-short-patch-repair endonuclease